MTEDELMEVSVRKLPHAVRYSPSTGKPDITLNITGSGRLLPALAKECQVPDDYADLLDVVEVVVMIAG